MELYETLCGITKKIFEGEDLSNLDIATDQQKELVEEKIKSLLEKRIGQQELDILENYVITHQNNSKLLEMGQQNLNDVLINGLPPFDSMAFTLNPFYCAGILLVMHKYLKENNYDIDTAIESRRGVLYSRETEEMLESLARELSLGE